MLTRKDFRELAKIIKDTTAEGEPLFIKKQYFINALCIFLKHNNKKFSSFKFKDAIGD